MKKAKLKYENPTPINVDDNDFDKILLAISPADSVHVYANGVRKNMYRPYLREAFEIIAYTGMRIEEALSIKYSDIVLDEFRAIEYVQGNDLKYERA